MLIRARVRPRGWKRTATERKIAAAIDLGAKNLDIRDFVGSLELNASNRPQFRFLNRLWAAYARGGEEQTITVTAANGIVLASFGPEGYFDRRDEQDVTDASSGEVA